MQLTRQNIQIVEKIIENQDGLFSAHFQIIETAGVIRWKLICITKIDTPINSIKETLLIEAPVIGQNYEIEKNSQIKKISPYFSLYFFVSQPTRAPNF